MSRFYDFNALELMEMAPISIFSRNKNTEIFLDDQLLGRVRISTLRNENETFSQLNSITYIGVFLRLVTYSHLPKLCFSPAPRPVARNVYLTVKHLICSVALHRHINCQTISLTIHNRSRDIILWFSDEGVP